MATDILYNNYWAFANRFSSAYLRISSKLSRDVEGRSDYPQALPATQKTLEASTRRLLKKYGQAGR